MYFVADAVPVAGMHGGFRGAAPVLFLACLRDCCNKTISLLTYGARSQGGGGLLMPTFPVTEYLSPYTWTLMAMAPYSLPIQPIRVISAVVGCAVLRRRWCGREVLAHGQAKIAITTAPAVPFPRQVLHNDRVIATLSTGDKALQTIADLRFKTGMALGIHSRTAIPAK